MFSFFRKRDRGLDVGGDFSGIGVDIHSHLIPGIDDGAKTMEDSLDLIKVLKGLGFRKIITTPHIHSEYYLNTREGILEGVGRVKEALLAAGMEMDLEASAEYYMDEHFEGLLDRDELLPLAGKYVLVETSFYGAPPKLDQYFFKIQTKGFVPILAHPERYFYRHGDLRAFEEMREKGVLLQLNTLSLTGHYGPAVLKQGRELLKAGLIDVLGTDMHHAGHGEGLKKGLLDKEVLRVVLGYPFRNRELF